MLELIAQGKTAQDRWRKVLLQNMPIELGRTTKDWTVGWDEKISRRHARMRLIDKILCVERIEGSANPIFFNGQEEVSFSIDPGEHFVIGDTTFLLSNDSALVTLELPSPISKRAFSNEFLKQVRYRDADHRIEVLNRLPEIISSSNDTEVLHGQMVNLLLSGIVSATEVAICRMLDNENIEVVAWDKRGMAGGDFHPSASLIQQALSDQKSTLHIWRGANAGPSNVTVDLANDWAFVCPLNGPSNKGWALYVAGVSRTSTPGTDSDVEAEDIQGDVKFAELVGATLANLRRVKQLETRQSTFRPFFSPVVLNAFVDQDPEEVLQPRECEISVLFCDLRGFSAKSEQMANQLEVLLDRVSKALGLMTKAVLDFGGVIGDFHGDSAMGFWGWPLDRTDAAENVCRAALRIQAELHAIANQPDHQLHDFQMGIGVATGNAVAGKIGTSHQVKVTAFGPVVNLAARYEGMTRQLNIPILVDKNTCGKATSFFKNDPVNFRLLGKCRPFGLNTASEVYQLFLDGDFPDSSILQAYRDGLDQFNGGDWEKAKALLKQTKNDDPAAEFLCSYLESRDKPADFDGVIDFHSK